MPPAKDRVVFFELAPIRGLDDIPQGMMSIIEAISDGKLNPPEGELLSRILTEYAKAMTSQDVELRLQKVEQGILQNDQQHLAHPRIKL